jgi:membrane-associated phospholipid phosphatase
MLSQIINYFGFFGIFILNILTIVLLLSQYTYLLFYLIGGVLNFILNISLKLLIRIPRPNGDKHLFNIMNHRNKRILIDKFGMPSGHAQSIGFSTCYAFLTIKNKKWLFFYGVVCILTLYQRYNNKNHTLFQLFIGLVVGIIVAYFMYFTSKRYITYLVEDPKPEKIIEFSNPL